ncbi:MAG: hypothetical protein MUP66_02315 [Candidatus Nanohaloarchaeota archaeon QJJ-5]|nr:hypothetical protein [Candidatus Nanohaloarchaeota archaeon QJJ-5]
MRFGKRILEGYLALALAILAVAAFIMLGSVGAEIDTGFVILSILVIILTGASIVGSILQLRTIAAIEELHDDDSESDEDESEDDDEE